MHITCCVAAFSVLDTLATPAHLLLCHSVCRIIAAEDATPGEKINSSLRLDRLRETISPREGRGMRPPIGRRALSVALVEGCGDATRGALSGSESRCCWSGSIGLIPSMSIV